MKKVKLVEHQPNIFGIDKGTGFLSTCPFLVPLIQPVKTSLGGQSIGYQKMNCSSDCVFFNIDKKDNAPTYLTIDCAGEKHYQVEDVLFLNKDKKIIN